MVKQCEPGDTCTVCDQCVVLTLARYEKAHDIFSGLSLLLYLLLTWKFPPNHKTTYQASQLALSVSWTLSQHWWFYSHFSSYNMYCACEQEYVQNSEWAAKHFMFNIATVVCELHSFCSWAVSTGTSQREPQLLWRRRGRQCKTSIW